MKTLTNKALRGSALLDDRKLTKSTAFSKEEREVYGLRGLLPAKICNSTIQEERILRALRNISQDIDKYSFLIGLLERNERLFYQILVNNLEEVMPLIYTPTVGQACKEFAQNFRKTRGFYINPGDKGDIRKILNNWPVEDVRVIVVTDGERILGLGDLGSNGMGIPIGKLQLYVAGAGIDPEHCMPVTIDVGTNNEALLNDPMYLGWQHNRLRGQEYFDLIDEFVTAVKDKFPKALIQFEDFSTDNAYKLLNRYRDKCLCFNDDIQGTAAVVLAGIYAYQKASQIEFQDMKFMFLGAGAAATGIGDLIVSALVEMGVPQDQAYRQLWFIDSKGLVVASRTDLADYKKPYAHEYPGMDFSSALDSIKPNVLIGATGTPGTFTQSIVERLVSFHERPAIFALSNPTANAECTAQQAYAWSQGKAIFCSGSPFAPVELNGQVFRPGQGNNAYIFPGIGLGAVACSLSSITDDMFLEAAKTLANMVTDQDLSHGTMYPRLTEIRKVSHAIAVAVAKKAFQKGLAQIPEPENIDSFISEMIYQPGY